MLISWICDQTDVLYAIMIIYEIIIKCNSDYLGYIWTKQKLAAGFFWLVACLRDCISLFLQAPFHFMPLLCTGVDLSKILGGQTKILWGQKVVKSDKCMGVSQLLGARARAAPLSLRLCYCAGFIKTLGLCQHKCLNCHRTCVHADFWSYIIDWLIMRWCSWRFAVQLLYIRRRSVL